MNKHFTLQDVIDLINTKRINATEVPLRMNQKSFSVSFFKIGLTEKELDHPNQTFFDFSNREDS